MKRNVSREHIVVRFPPSPTGSLHIGNIRSLLFNYLFARKHGGEIVMRFEDTDRERSDAAHEALALEALEALGLDFDRGPFRQSERTERYVEALHTLIASGKAFVAEASEGEQGAHVVRFRNPRKEVTFHDIIRGDITIDTTDFGDFVIARSEDSPLYHLAVVVDDIDMGITHVIRGEDHITSTPRQMLLIEALGGDVPTYAHLPLIVGPDKKKLSKRHGAVTYQDFRALGYIPIGILNYLALLGWNPGDDREFFTKEELIGAFSLERVNNSPATFSYEKLDSINRHHILQLPTDEYEREVKRFLTTTAEGERLCAHPRFHELVTLVVRERISKFSDAATMLAAGEFDWMLHTPHPTADALRWKDTAPADVRAHLAYIRTACAKLSDWTVENIKESVWDYAQQHGKGSVLWPMRYALTGRDRSPDPFTVAYLVGQDETLARLKAAEQLL